jgi:hypothetical protein
VLNRKLAALALATGILATGCHGKLDIWEHNGFTGRVSQRTGDDATFTNNGWVNDNASSFANHTGKWAVVYEHSNYGGVVLCLAPGASVFAADQYRWGFGNNFNDRASSLQFKTSRPPGGVCTWTVNGAG